MSWVRVDDQAVLHPKLLAVGPDGVCLWLAGLCYANAHTTDGYIPMHALPALYPSDKWSRVRQNRAAAALVSVGCWHAEGQRWRIHGYAEYQEEALRANVEERREYERTRKAEQRLARKTAQIAKMSQRDTPGHVPGTTVARVQGTPSLHERGTDAHAEQGLTPSVSRPPVPALPVPARPIPNEGERARVRSLLVRGYQSRYEAATGSPWLSAGQAGASLDVVAAWALATSEPEVRVEDVLDGAFADEWMTSKRWPWGPIAKDPAKFADAGRGTAAERAKASRSERLAEIKRELEAARARGDHGRADELESERDAIAFGRPQEVDPVPAGSREGDVEDRAREGGSRAVGRLLGAVGART